MRLATNSGKPHDQGAWVEVTTADGEQNPVSAGVTGSGRLDPGLRVNVGPALGERITTAGTECVLLKSPRDSPRNGKKKKKHSKSEKGERGDKGNKGHRDGRNASASHDEGQGDGQSPTGQELVAAGAGAVMASEDPAGAILQREASGTRPQVSRSNSLMRNSTSLDALRSADRQADPASPSSPLNTDSLVIETNSLTNSPEKVVGSNSELRRGSRGSSGREVFAKHTPGDCDRSRLNSGRGTPLASNSGVDSHHRQSPAAEQAREQADAHTHITFVPTSAATDPPGQDEGHHYGHRHSRKHRDRAKERHPRSPSGPRPEGAPTSLSSQAVVEATLLAESTHSAKSNGSSASRHRSGSRGGRRAGAGAGVGAGGERQSVESVALQAGLDRTPSSQNRLSRQRSGSGGVGGGPAVGSPVGGAMGVSVGRRGQESTGRRQRTDQETGNCTVS